MKRSEKIEGTLFLLIDIFYSVAFLFFLFTNPDIVILTILHAVALFLSLLIFFIFKNIYRELSKELLRASIMVYSIGYFLSLTMLLKAS